MTNYEKIKNMTVEEMADLLNDFSACSRFTDYCPNCGAKMDLEE